MIIEGIKKQNNKTRIKHSGNKTYEDGLENYYAGDKVWKKFAKICSNIKTKNTKKLLSLFNNNIEVVNVIEYRNMETSLKWIELEIPALNNLKPIDCIKNKKLLKRLKECLLRMD